MIRRLISLFLVVALFAITAHAGFQQDFFMASVHKAARVRIERIGPDKTAKDGIRRHLLLDSAERKKIEEVPSHPAEPISPSPTGSS